MSPPAPGQIAQWLEKLGLGQYAQRFVENEITPSILPELTDADLKELGVSALGHRRLLLRAIAELDGIGRTAQTHATAISEPATPERRDTAERRQVTVMFCDLVGSTALSARMDPEDLHEVISAYQKCVAEIVRRFDGFVAKYLGDGALVYFGYPQAHEDDAERAVRAGLGLVATVTALKSPMPLQARVGIATGLVVVGDLIKSEDAVERGIVGETPNLAARLQGIAEPNTVVIGESTQRLLGNLFELEDLGSKDLKGIARPTLAWAALRPSSVASRFEALHGDGLTELVGREEEVELLLRRWARAKGGEGQVVLVSGEPGIGKSRLTAALMERLSEEPHTRLRYFCSPQYTDSALYPIIDQMERAAGLTYEDTAEAKLDKLNALLAQSSTVIENTALFAEMLSFRNDGRYPALELTPQQRREKTLRALVLQLEALSHQAPVLMIFEDTHWADPTSVEVLGLVVARITKLQVLLIATFRPEFEPPWIGQPHVTALTVNRLAERDIGAMIDRIVGNQALSVSLRQDIVDRTDGIPLFVEEMTKTVLEAGTEDDAHRTAAAVPLSVVPVPASLHASLMARLDRLGPAKEVAQIGAAIGREFSHLLLQEVVGKTEAQQRSGLDRLIDSGLLFRQGTPSQATYLFKHALVQDAAYGTLLREPRRALHARIADALEARFPEIVENQPELLARHCTEAGLIEKAVGLWGKAGQRSLARSALVEAAEQLGRALAQITELPSTPALRREEIRVQVGLAMALMYTKGYAAPEAIASFDQARLLIERGKDLREPLEDPLLLFSVLHGIWLTSLIKFNGDAACERATQFLALAEEQSATFPLVQGHRLAGQSLLYAGDFVHAQTHFDRAIALYNSEEHRPLAMRIGADIGVILGSGLN
jgi:class 3 adenylate cyclase